MGLLKFSDGSLDACGNEEILLFQTQLFSCIMVVIRIQHFHNVFSQVFLFYSFVVFSLIKKVKTEVCNRLRIPDTKGIYDFIIISYDRHIIRNCQYRLIALLHKTGPACSMVVFRIYITAEFYFFCIFRTAQFKGIAVFQPVVRNLYLITVFDFLLKQTVMVTDTAAVSAVAQGSQRIQETCSQTSQSSVSKSRVRFLVFYYIQVKS